MESYGKRPSELYCQIDKQLRISRVTIKLALLRLPRVNAHFGKTWLVNGKNSTKQDNIAVIGPEAAYEVNGGWKPRAKRQTIF